MNMSERDLTYAPVILPSPALYARLKTQHDLREAEEKIEEALKELHLDRLDFDKIFRRELRAET